MLRREFKGAFTIWYRDVLRFVRDPMRMVGSLGQPLLFLFVFGGGMAGSFSGMGRMGAATAAVPAGFDFKQFLFPGIVGMTVLFTAVFSALSIVWDREFGFLREVLVAPVSRTAVALGKVAGGSTVALFQGTIILLLAPVIGVKLSFLQVISLWGVMLLLAAVMCSFGLLVAARQKSMEGFQVIMQFLLMPMFFLSGAFFPLKGVPTWLTVLGRIDPVSYGIDALRQVALAGTVPPETIAAMHLHPVHVDLAILGVLLVAFLVPAIWQFSRQD